MKSLNIRQIRYFAAVVEHGSLSAAAKTQHITVQAVSKAIADLERELGQSLFVRESRGVHPTPCGDAFYQEARSVLSGFDELEAFAGHYKESQKSERLRLALCTPPFFNNEPARMHIASFVKRGLGIDASVDLSWGEETLEFLRRRDFDALITIGTVLAPDIDCVPAGTITPGLMMAADHPLAGSSDVSLADMKKYPVLAPDSLDAFSQSVVAAYRDKDVDVNMARLTEEGMDSLLKDEQALIFVAGILALGELYPGAVTKLVAPEDAVAIPVCLVSLKEWKTPAYRAFEEWLAGELILLGSGFRQRACDSF